MTRRGSNISDVERQLDNGNAQVWFKGTTKCEEAAGGDVSLHSCAVGDDQIRPYFRPYQGTSQGLN
jgi:hypothetical protein